MPGSTCPADDLRRFSTPFRLRSQRPAAPSRRASPVPDSVRTAGRRDAMSTQQGFGRLLADIGRTHPELADHIVTTSPDVTVSTNLGGWVNRRGIFLTRPIARIRSRTSGLRRRRTGRCRRAVSTSSWGSPRAICSSCWPRLVCPVRSSDRGCCRSARSTTRSSARGLDALNYACYQDARFILVGTPSGLSLAPEGGAHQSIYTPLIGIGQPGLTAFEPAFVDELGEILRWSFEHLQDERRRVGLPASVDAPVEATAARDDGRPQGRHPGGRLLARSPAARRGSGDRRVRRGRAGGDRGARAAGGGPARRRADGRDVARSARARVATVEALAASRLAYRATARGCFPSSAGLITVVDAHPATLSWLGAVDRHRVIPLGVDRFGQSGDIPDLYPRVRHRRRCHRGRRCEARPSVGARRGRYEAAVRVRCVSRVGGGPCRHAASGDDRAEVDARCTCGASLPASGSGLHALGARPNLLR